MDDGTRPTTDDVVMAVGEPERAADPEVVTNGDPAASDRRRWWRWAATFTALVVVGWIAWNQSATQPTVRASDGINGMSRVPPAPDRPVTARWSATVADDERLVSLGVHDDLVVAVAGPQFGDDPPLGRAMAWDAATGVLRWERPLRLPPGPDPTELRLGQPRVHVVGGDTTTTLAMAPRAAAYDRGLAQVALRAADGRVAWQRSWADGTATAYPEHGVVTEVTRTLTSDAATVSTIVRYATTGRELFTTGGTVVPASSGWLRLVSQGDRWDLLARDGTPRATLGSTTRPVLLGDVVVSVEGTEVIGTGRDGQRLWTARLPGTDPIAATRVRTRLERLDAETVLAATWRNADAEVGRLDQVVLATVDADGTVRELAADVVAQVVLDQGLGLVTGGGPPLLVCADATMTVADGCPDHLALVGLDGSVRGRSDTNVVPPGTVAGSGLPGLATTTGLLVLEGDALVLRRWQDLVEAWRVPVPGYARHPLAGVVVPAASGLAVGHVNDEPGQPDQVTWLS